MIWYIGRNGARQGPFDEPTLRAMAARGEIEPHDLVWRAGDADWREAVSVPGLLAARPPSGPPDADGPTLSATPTAGNYFTRHWRGELSLPISYWVNGFAAAIAVAGMAALAGQMDWTEMPELAAAVAAGVLLFAVVVTLWQLVGIWRSAERHPARGGRPGWATLAKVSVILGLLRTVVDVNVTLIPQLGMAWEIVTGDERFSGYTLRVLRDAAELEIAGPIGFGLTNEVERTLDAHPTIGALHLNSEGGRVTEAKKLGRLIKARGLSTYVAGECLSACTVAFMGGQERLVGPEAQLGFHAFDVPGGANLQADIKREGIEFYVEQGVDRAFARRALETPPTGMWYPSREELEGAGVITGLAGEGEFGLSGFTPAALGDVERELLKLDVLVALKEHEPATYEAIVAPLREAVLRGRSILDVREEVMPHVQELYLARLPYGDDASVLALTRVMLAQMRALRAQSGLACTRFITNEAPVSAGLAVPLELRQQEMALLGDLVRSAATGRYGPQPGAAFDRQLNVVLERMEARWGEDVELLGEVGDPDSRANPEQVCAVAIGLYETVLERPPAVAAQILRTMYASE
jgi:hypothetical protein